MKKNITVTEILIYQERAKNCKTIGEFKEVGRELRDKFNITDSQALSLINNRKNILNVISEIENQEKF
jgi:hypothetical protein